MPYTIYDTTVPNLKSGLVTLAHILDKAEEFASEKGIAIGDLLASRIHEDMLPLTFQFRIATDAASKCVARLHGTEPTKFPDEDLKTPDDIRARIKAVQEIVATADRAKIESRADAIVPLALGPRGTFEVKAGEYVNCYTLPNFFFHVTTAYAILRMKGVPLGKTDYLKSFTPPAVVAKLQA